MNKRIIAFVLAGIFAISMVANPVGAVTVEQLQSLIAELSAKIALLEAQLAGQPAATTGLCLTGDLSLGMTSAEVKILQQGLNQSPATQVAVSGAGAPGYETSYFGALTKAAVIKFQDIYAPEVLASWGLTKGTGYAGQTTRAKFNALYCTPVTTTTTVPGETTTTTVPVAEGTLTVSDSAIFQETTLHKADTGKVVLAFEAKAQDSALTVQRIDVNFVKTGDSILPWQTFKTFYLYQGSTLLKEITAVKEDYVENKYAENYTLRFTGLSAPIVQDATKTFSLKTDVFANPSNTAAYDLKVLTNGVRAVDTAGINQYDPADDTTVVNSIGAISETTAALNLSTASDSPVEGVIIGDATSVVVDQGIVKFNLKATTGNITVRTIDATITTLVDTDEADVVSAAKLYDGNTLLKSKAVANGGAISFDRLNLLISAGTTKVLTIKVDLKPVATEGCSVAVVVAKTDVTASDSQDTVVDAGGSDVSGKKLHIYTVAPIFTFISGKVIPDANSSANATAEIKFSVTANGGDVYIPDSADKTGNIILTDIYGTAAGTSTLTSYVTTGATAGGNSNYLVYSGGTETFTVSSALVVDPDNTGLMGAKISKIFWATTDTTIDATTSTAYGLELFQSGLINLH